jgi:Sulfotransferase domain
MKDTVDFIVVGAQKSGTTSLFEYLRQNPGISMPEGKEVPYFSHQSAYARGWPYYLRTTFPFADEGTKWGTATPHYMTGGLWEETNSVRNGGGYDERTVPTRIATQLPDVRLIALLRDPVARARSHHRMAHMNRIDRRSFSRAIDDLLRPEALETARREPRETTGYVTWGEYGRILQGYLDVFPRKQLLIVFTEELEVAPERLLQRVQRFVGVQDDFVPPNVGMRFRVGATERRLSWLGTYARLNPLGLQHAVSQMSSARRAWYSVPEPGRRKLDRAFAQVTYRLDLWNRRTNDEGSEDDGDVVDRLRAHYEHDGRRLVELLGQPIPWISCVT